MARASSAAQQRQLTATEELEKLEQSITLTLQEIDHNFSRAHRIVTSSILPIVEQYAAHSRDVWEGSKFWKQFFESSANVSLSGYEEQSLQRSHLPDETTTETEESNATTSHTTLETSESYSTPSAQHISADSIQDLDISNMTLSPSKSSTPRPSHKQRQNDAYPQSTPAQFAEYPSPYEALRQEVNQTAVDTTTFTENGPEDDTQRITPSTPGPQPRLYPSHGDTTPQSSPFLPPPPGQPNTTTRPSTTRKRTDPLLHRILDKNYRVQATPLTSRKHQSTNLNNTTTPGTSQRTTRRLFDSSPMSSPDVPAPQLHTELFSPQRPNQQNRGPRTPGVSVLSPARKQRPTTTTTKAAGHSQAATAPRSAARTPPPTTPWDIDSDSDSELQFASPPKTMQFHIPQNRLLKTPAKEATRLIVDSILSTAGIRPSTTTSSHHPNNNHPATADIELTEDDIDFDYDPNTAHNYDYNYNGDDDDHHGNNNVTPAAFNPQKEYPEEDLHDVTGVLEERSPTVVRGVGVEDESF